MMLQNHTYVDPVMDPVVLLTLLLGLVFLTAAVLIYVTIRSLPMSNATSAESGLTELPAFVAPDLDRTVLTPSVSVRRPDADGGMPETGDRRPRRSHRARDAQHASRSGATSQ